MNVQPVEKPRRIVPRWREYAITAATGELKSLSPAPVTLPQLNLEELERSRQAWQTYRSLPYAGEFLSNALVVGLPQEAHDAAQYVLDSILAPGESLSLLAKKVLGIPSPIHNGEEDSSLLCAHIARLKRSLAEDPRNAIARIDMARSYAVLAQNKLALNQIEMALTLNPDNRFVLRSAVRFLLHLHKEDQAWNLLKRSARTKTDPWLMAAEIAVATLNYKDSSNLKEANRLLDRKGNLPIFMTELASAVATVEMNSTSSKIARRLFRRSMDNPTENSLAQAIWASTSINDLQIEPETITLPFSYEAQAREAYIDKRWNDTIRLCYEWFRDEPFASRPALLATYLALATQGAADWARQIAEEALHSNPKEEMLRNNLVVALVELGRLDEAEKEFVKLPTSNQNSDTGATYEATRGLLEFRKGNVEIGRTHYESAIKHAEKEKSIRHMVLAKAHYAREELLAGSDRYVALLESAVQASAYIEDPSVHKFLSNIQSEVTRIEEQPSKRIKPASFSRR